MFTVMGDKPREQRPNPTYNNYTFDLTFEYLTKCNANTCKNEDPIVIVI